MYRSSFTRDIPEFAKTLHVDCELREGSRAADSGETVGAEAQLGDSGPTGWDVLISTSARKVPASDSPKYPLFLLLWVTHFHFLGRWVE